MLIKMYLLIIGAIYYGNAHFGEGNGPILMSMHCNSIQDSLFDCSIRNENIPLGSHRFDAGVKCQRKSVIHHNLMYLNLNSILPKW